MYHMYNMYFIIHDSSVNNTDFNCFHWMTCFFLKRLCHINNGGENRTAQNWYGLPFLSVSSFFLCKLAFMINWNNFQLCFWVETIKVTGEKQTANKSYHTHNGTSNLYGLFLRIKRQWCIIFENVHLYILREKKKKKNLRRRRRRTWEEEEERKKERKKERRKKKKKKKKRIRRIKKKQSLTQKYLWNGFQRSYCVAFEEISCVIVLQSTFSSKCIFGLQCTWSLKYVFILQSKFLSKCVSVLYSAFLSFRNLRHCLLKICGLLDVGVTMAWI